MLNMLKQVRGKQGALDADELATQCNELEHSALNFVTSLQHDAVPHPVEAGAEAGVHAQTQARDNTLRKFARAMHHYHSGRNTPLQCLDKVGRLLSKAPESPDCHARFEEFLIAGVERVNGRTSRRVNAADGLYSRAVKRRGTREAAGGGMAAKGKKRRVDAASPVSSASASSPHQAAGCTRPVSVYEDEDKVRNSGSIAASQRPEGALAHYSRSSFRYQGIAVIDVTLPHADGVVSRERRNGNPIVLANHKAWTEFAADWVCDDGTLDADRFVADVGADTEVPIVRPGYDEKQPVKEHMRIGEFITDYWQHNNCGAYLHQWQFAVTEQEDVRTRLNSGTLKAQLPCLGHNLLQHWVDLCRGANPLQYLFMGPTNTYSKLHRDNGGCAILIAPITGRKEVILVHRDDTVHLYDLTVDVSCPDLHRFPSLAFARVWRQVIEPGQILLMPAGTYHACRNVTPCLSYSCFHLDAVNAPHFYKSFLAEDAPELSHAEILWNSSHDLMELVDAAADDAVRDGGRDSDSGVSHSGAPNNDNIVVDAEAGRSCEAIIATQVEHLRVLRHLVRAIQLDAHTPAASGWNWSKLLRAIDLSLHDYEMARKQGSSRTNATLASAVQPKSVSSSPVSFPQQESTLATPSTSVTSKTGARRAMQGDASDSMEPPGADLARSLSNSSKVVLDSSKKVPDEEWARLTRIAWKRCAIAVGHTIEVQRRRHKCVVAGKVLRVCHGHMAMIHYMGWSNVFDEIYPVDEMELLHTSGDGGGGDSDSVDHDDDGKPVKDAATPRAIRSNDHVKVPWGVQGDKYTAVVLWTTPKVDGAQVQFLHDAKEDEGWSLQWVTGLDIVPKQRKSRRTRRE